MSLLNVENIRTILEQKQTELSKVDQEYAKKLYSEKLFNNPANKKNMELGCEILAEKLKNISSVDIPYSYNSEIKHKLFSEEEYDKMKNVKYFYTNCRAMKDFVKSNENEFNRLNNEVVFRSKTILAGQVYADQFIFSLIYPIIFMMSTGLMLDNISPEHWKYIKENKKFNFEMMKSSFDKNWENVKNKYLTIYMTDCAVWPLIQIGNFAFVPAIYQPIFVNFINIFWNAFLCYVSQGH